MFGSNFWHLLPQNFLGEGWIGWRFNKLSWEIDYNKRSHHLALVHIRRYTLYIFRNIFGVPICITTIYFSTFRLFWSYHFFASPTFRMTPSIASFVFWDHDICDLPLGLSCHQDDPKRKHVKRTAKALRIHASPFSSWKPVGFGFLLLQIPFGPVHRSMFFHQIPWKNTLAEKGTTTKNSTSTHWHVQFSFIRFVSTST